MRKIIGTETIAAFERLSCGAYTTDIKSFQFLDHRMPCPEIGPCVYALIEGEEVVYIGQSVVPFSRINTHKNDSEKDFSEVALLRVPEGMLDLIESYFIWRYKPKYNGACTVPKENPLIHMDPYNVTKQPKVFPRQKQGAGNGRA